MALERNNPTMQFEPGCDPEFERILRRHLKLGGAPVAACAGFDADTASAFLENALGSAAQAKFESHLAGCPACRRHVIELSRLMEPISAPAPVPVKTDRLAALKQWFDFSAWGWKWQTAGLAAAALLIGAVSSPLWLSNSNSLSRTDSVAFVAKSESDANVAGAAPASSPEFTEKEVGIPNRTIDEIAASQLLSRRLGSGADKQPIPGPMVAMREQDVSIVQDLARESVSRRAKQFELPQTFTAYSGPLSTFQQQNLDVVPPTAAPAAPEPPRTEAVTSSSQSLVGLQVAPRSDDNPMLDAKSERSRASSAAGQKTMSKAVLTSFLPFGRSEKAEKEEKPSASARVEEETPSLTHKIHGRIFRFENDLWVDQDYTPKMRWRVTRLIRGSNEYEVVLSRNPQLKEFFEKAPILVIWKDSIYKVVVK